MITAAAGTAATVSATQQASKAQERAERARESAMNLDARRRQRQILREAQVARATALSNATSQGAQGGSGLQGAYGQVSGEANTASVGVEQNRQLGSEIFAANRQYASAQSTAAFGGALQSVGGQILQNRGAIARVGQYAFG